MKGISQYSASLVLLLITTQSNASTYASTIPLADGVIEPGKIFAVKTDPLYHDVRYIVSCTLDTDKEETLSTLVNLSKDNLSYYGSVRMNGKGIELNQPIRSSSNHAEITLTSINKIHISSVNIYNLDYSEQYKIHCVEDIQF